MDKQQERGRTMLDEIAESWEDDPDDEWRVYATPREIIQFDTIANLIVLAQACRDAEAILTYMGMHDLKAEDSTRIANVLIALQPLLAPIEAGDEATE